MIIEISVAIIATAFVVLVIFLILILLSAKKTLEQTTRTLKKVDGLTMGIEQQVQALDSVFNAVSILGDKVLEKAKAVNSHVDTELAEETFKPQDKLTSVIQWISTGINIWMAFKKRGGNYERK